MKNFKKEYDKLDDKEKVRRLEWIAKSYAAWLDCENWEDSPYVDATKYWPEFEEQLNNKDKAK